MFLIREAVSLYTYVLVFLIDLDQVNQYMDHLFNREWFRDKRMDSDSR